MKTTRAFAVRTAIPYLGDRRRERMDAYLPMEPLTRPAPALILVHGGGWTEGSRKGEREVAFAETLAAAGFAVFSIDYALGRWSGSDGSGHLREAAWPQCLYDCQAAVRHVREHADAYGVDPHRLALAGGCAGAHLALMAAMDGANASGLNCVVVSRGFFTASDSIRRRLVGDRNADNPVVVHAAAPVDRIRPGLPPVLAIHGTRDTVAPLGEAQALMERLGHCGVEHRLICVDGEGHNLRLDRPPANLMPVVETFLRWHLVCR